MTKRALVLGGGGSVGIAWETGLAAGLADEGIDLRLADKIVGTSAGSFVGAELASGRVAGRVARAADRRRADARRPEFDADARLPVPDLTKLMEFMMRVPKDEAEALKLRAEIGAYALEAATIPEEACIGFFASVADTPWPAKYSCTAVDAQDGRFVVLRSEHAARHSRAASRRVARCPGSFRRSRSTAAAITTAASAPRRTSIWPKAYERVIAVAVIPPGGADFMAARIDPELAQLRRGGSHVELITPDAASLDAFGPNLMDASRQAAVLEAGVKQGRAEAVRIRVGVGVATTDSRRGRA